MEKGAPSAVATGGNSTVSGASKTLNLISRQEINNSGSSRSITAGFNQEATKGSPYLFNGWVHGYAVDTNDSLVNDIHSLYNYDKMSGNLLVTTDQKAVMEVNASKFKRIFLFDGKGKTPHIFQNGSESGFKPITEVLLSTPKYRIYKVVDTKLQRADFHSNGITESGNKYDEYVDNVKYYFVTLPGGKPQSISLKKSNIKKVLGTEADQFISSQGSRDVDEDYVRDLNFSLQ